MKKLNNKGITTIELIISFVLIIMVASSLFSTITAYNEKRLVEGYKAEILTYKNSLTKLIQDDFIKIGVTKASYKRYTSGTTSNNGYEILKSNDKMTIYQIDCILEDGTPRRLIIYQQFTKSNEHITGSTTKDDYFMIEYGTPDLTKGTVDAQNEQLIEYPLPNVGSHKADNGLIAKDLTINNVLISFGQDETYSTTNILSIYIGFYHPELSTKYGINIICPINYKGSGKEKTNSFDI